nr:ATPbinding Cassette (ABC) superfamily putative [Albugo laibachii Nc14]|eukprot:CCA16962.1 ATPbinding Cassette (ABC) superfamily putative [Albugo laibachii Nc14]
MPITFEIVQRFKREHQIPCKQSIQRQIDIQSTAAELCGGFLYKDANAIHQVFGGVIISWMDRAAVQCARRLTKNRYMATTGISRLHFKLPIRVSEEIIVQARVCHVRTFVLEIEVAVYRSVPFKAPQHSYSGYARAILYSE